MKKPFTYQFFPILFLVFVCMAAVSCQSGTDKQSSSASDTVAGSDSTAPIPFDPEEEKATVLTINKEVLQVLKDKAYQQIPAFIHPVKGVRFSQHGYVDTTLDQGFSPERFQRYITAQNSQKLVWGVNNAGDSVRLSVSEYLAQKVYNKDFLSADSVGYNIIYRTVASPESMETVYGHAPFVSNHFIGDQQKYAGLDWRSLRLVFEEYNDQYYLVGVINDEWTP